MSSKRVVLGNWEKPRLDGYHTALTPNENAASTLSAAPLSYTLPWFFRSCSFRSLLAA